MSRRKSPWQSFHQKSPPDPLTDGYDKVRAIIREQAARQGMAGSGKPFRSVNRYCRACEKVFETGSNTHVFCSAACRRDFHKALMMAEGRCRQCRGVKEPDRADVRLCGK